MRGHTDPQSHLFSYFSPEDRVPASHPLRSIKAYTESALKQIGPLLDGLYSQIGRPSIPPERLLKAQLLIALYSVRSDRLLLDYIILFRWSLEMSLEEASFDASTFSKNRERLASEDIALRLFDAEVREARRLDSLSDEHFSVDGTLIEAWASMKSYRPKDGGGSGPDGSRDRDFKGEPRRNDTHHSTTDIEAKLKHKSLGKEAKVCFAGHALMDNRHGLITDVSVTTSVGVSETDAALALLARQRRKRLRPKSVGADKGTRRFVSALRERAPQRKSPTWSLETLAWVAESGNRTLIGRARSCACGSNSSLAGVGQLVGCKKRGSKGASQLSAHVSDRCSIQFGCASVDCPNHRIGAFEIWLCINLNDQFEQNEWNARPRSRHCRNHSSD